MYGFKDIYQFIVAYIASLFGIAVASGRINQFASMFLLISLFAVAVLAAEYTTLVIEKKRSIKDFAWPLVKAFCAIGIFMFFSLGTIFSVGIDSLTESTLYYITWAYTGIIISSYMIQILNFGKQIGLPGMAKLIEIVEQFSTIFTRYKK